MLYILSQQTTVLLLLCLSSLKQEVPNLWKLRNIFPRSASWDPSTRDTRALSTFVKSRREETRSSKCSHHTNNYSENRNWWTSGKTTGSPEIHLHFREICIIPRRECNNLQLLASEYYFVKYGGMRRVEIWIRWHQHREWRWTRHQPHYEGPKRVVIVPVWRRLRFIGPIALSSSKRLIQSRNKSAPSCTDSASMIAFTMWDGKATMPSF